MPNAVKPPARPRRHEARRAAASMLVQWSEPAHEPLRQRHQLHTPEKTRGHQPRGAKACDDGGNSGGIGSDEQHGRHAMCRTTRLNAAASRICRRRSRRRGRRRRW